MIFRGLFAIESSSFGSVNNQIAEVQAKGMDQKGESKLTKEKPVNIAMMRHAETNLIQYFYERKAENIRKGLEDRSKLTEE